MPTKDNKGTWTFPAGWSDADQAAFLAAQTQLDAELAALAKVEDGRAAAASSPAAVMLGLRIQADAARAAAAREAIETIDDAAELALRAQYGERIRVIYTAKGRLILTWTDAHEKLWDGVGARAKALTQAALEQAAPDPLKANIDSMKAYKEGYFDHVIVHPAKANARAILTSYPDAWDDCFEARAALARGPREAAGKGAGRA